MQSTIDNADMTDEVSVGDVMAEQSVELSIVMPCLNEAETLACCIRKAIAFLNHHNIRGEVIVGDNGSTDGSQLIAESEGARVVHVPVRGYGAALYYACNQARGAYIIMGDSDDSYDFSELLQFLDRLRAGDDLVMGNRFQGGIRPNAMPWKNRYIGNPVLSGLGRLLFRISVHDFHCGLRGFSKRAFNSMDLRTTGMEFASEIVIKARLLNLKISEVPTTLSPDGRSRPPHLRPWRDGWRHLRFMLLYSPNWLFLYPGLLMMLGALIGGGLLVAGPVTVGRLQFDLDSLIYLAFVYVIGFQSVLFSFLSRAYAHQEGLYPSRSQFTRILRYVTMERGLVAGVVMVLVGGIAAVASVVEWERHHFGAMDFSRLARLVIPSATCLTIGSELVLFSLFLSTLQLSVRNLSASVATDRRVRLPRYAAKSQSGSRGSALPV